MLLFSSFGPPSAGPGAASSAAPSAAPSAARPAARAPDPAPTATETVTRPDPGVARGKWEAPAWAFWVALAVLVIGVGLYVAKRMGLIRFKKRPAEQALVSKRGQR